MSYKREGELARVTNVGTIEKVISKGKAKNDNQYNEQVGIFHDAVVSELNRRMNFSHDDIVLDAGCGRGGLPKRVKKYVNCVVGVDLLRSSLKDFDDTTIPRIQCDVANLPFCDSSFDKIYSYSVTEFFPNMDYFRSFLTELLRVLKSGGILYIGDVFNGYFEDEYTLAQNPSMSTKVKMVVGRGYRKLFKYKKEHFHQFEYLYIRPDFFLVLDSLLNEEKIDVFPLLSTIKNKPKDVLKYRYDIMIIKKKRVGKGLFQHCR